MTSFGKFFSTILLLLIGAGVYFFVVVPINNQNKENTPEVVETDAEFQFSEEAELYEINATYPKVASVGIASDIDVFVWNKIGEFKKFFETLSEEDERVLRESAAGKYLLGIRYEVHEDTETEFVSYIFNVEEYTGGAHGNTSIVSLVYYGDDKITFSKLLKQQENVSPVAAVVQGSVAELLGDQADINWIAEGAGPDSENFKNFYIKDGEVVFLFPPYQVAPYAFGEIRVSASTTDMFGYFKKDYFPSLYESAEGHRGYVVFGGEVRAFSYCDGEEEYWYHDTTGSLQDEYLHAKRDEEPYEKVPAILQGYFRDIPEYELGFAAEYDGIFVVSDLLQVGGGGVCE
jgi:hypothetical protein